MNTFEHLKNHFSVNWTTIFVGWEGLGVFSPFRWEDFPPLLTLQEVYQFCYDRIAEIDDMKEIGLIVDVLEFEKKEPDRALVRFLITPLSELHHGDKAFELRKWRAIMLGEVLEQLQNNALSDSLSIGEFWMYYGYPSDSPMKNQDIDNVRPEEYGTEEYAKRVIVANKAWLRKEMQEIVSIAMPQ